MSLTFRTKLCVPRKTAVAAFKKKRQRRQVTLYIGMCTCMYKVGYNRLAKSLITPALDDVRMLTVDQILIFIALDLYSPVDSRDEP